MDIPVMLDRLRVDASGEIADGAFDLNMITIPALAPETASNYDGPTTTYVVQQGQELGLIAKEYNVSIEDIAALNGITDPDFIYPGEELTIPAAGVYVPPAPPAPTSVGRSIVVSTENQRIYAYQDGQMVRTHLVSTGLPDTPTVKGDFKIYVKYLADDMSGPGYYLPQVPYTMYFYPGLRDTRDVLAQRFRARDESRLRQPADRRSAVVLQLRRRGHARARDLALVSATVTMRLAEYVTDTWHPRSARCRRLPRRPNP